VHRDLKPGNIVLTKSGAKILDFGVAKLREEQVVDMATRTTPLTSHGAMVGTVQYMSPEQLEGKPVDHRADLFAFGALLYEMLTGQRAFAGQSQASVIASILTAEPRPVSELLPATPAALDRVVRQCLAKDPDDRWSSAGDLARELRWIAEGKAGPATHVAPASSRPRREWAAWALAVVGLAVGALGLNAARSRGPELAMAPVTRFSVLPTNGQVEGAPMVSPDGRFVVYSFIPDAGIQGLWLHSMETGQAKELTGTRGGRLPFWSPDGKAIAFFAEGRLKRTALGGEPPQVLCDASDPRGGAWGSGGDVLFTRNSASGLFRVADSGGSVTTATEALATAGEQSHRFPEFLPDGKHFLYTATGAPQATGVYWTSLDGGKAKKVLSDTTRVKFDQRGFLVFRRSGALMAQRFAPESGELSSEPVLLASDVGTDAQITALDQFSISNNGVLALRTGASQKLRMTWVDRSGASLGNFAEGYRLNEPILSPDGTRIAAGGGTEGQSDSSIWLIDLQSNAQITRLTFGDNEEETPVWSADGRFVTYSTLEKDGWALKRKAISGEGQETTVVTANESMWADGESPDGRFIVCERYGTEMGSDLWIVPLTGDRTMIPFRRTKANETHSAISPDGRYLAYVSDELGLPEVFVETIPASGSRWQISSGGADQPMWSRDGKALYYLASSRMLHEVEIKQAVPFRFGAPIPLFRLAVPTVSATGPRSHYVVVDGGKRFAVNSLVGEAQSRGFEAVLNWNGEPAGK
jgi:Tol biopolymer transport system component